MWRSLLNNGGRPRVGTLLPYRLPDMAINTHRALRRIEEYVNPKVETTEHVAPGTYTNTHNELKPLPGEVVAPFSSMQNKVLNKNTSTSSLTPGPGAYLGQEHTRRETAPTSLRSSSARMGPTSPGSSIYMSSTIEKNPGPGEYDARSDWTPRIRKALREAAPLVPEAADREKSAPSIPAQRLPPGQSKKSDSQEADISKTVMQHTGENHDTVGPGEYEVKPDCAITQPSVQQTAFYASKLTRKLWEPSVSIECKQAPWENPGPGSYDTDLDKNKLPDPELDTAGTFQFASKSRLAHQRSPDEEKVVPGPGTYQLQGHIDQSIKIAKEAGLNQGDRSCFGSVTDRVGWSRDLEQPFTDAYNVRHVPGPGHYPRPPSFPKGTTEKERAAEKNLPSFRRKKIHGVHHPQLITALQEADGPLQAFNCSDDRPCNKDVLQRTPAPWQYNKEQSTGSSMNAELRERAKIGRRGVFGTCADRFYGNPLLGRAGLPEPGMDVSEDRSSGANAEPRSMFRSGTSRFPVSPGPREVNANTVGPHETPAPGAYEVTKEANYRSPHNLPRNEHEVSFGSCKNRYHRGVDIFEGLIKGKLNPGPGEYDGGPISPKVVGGARSKSERASPRIGSTTEVVGPGSYGEIDTPMLKRTWNRSMRAPLAPRGSAPGRPMKGRAVA